MPSQWQWIIVDGYNLLHRASCAERANFGEGARHRVVRMLEEVAPCLADRMTIIFDGRESNSEIVSRMGDVEIRFSPKHLTADSEIERLVCEAPRPEDILVISSDIAERKTVEAAGARSMSCGDFLILCDNVKRQIRETHRDRAQRMPPITLGDYFPKKRL